MKNEKRILKKNVKMANMINNRLFMSRKDLIIIQMKPEKRIFYLYKLKRIFFNSVYKAPLFCFFMVFRAWSLSASCFSLPYKVGL